MKKEEKNRRSNYILLCLKSNTTFFYRIIAERRMGQNKIKEETRNVAGAQKAC